MAAAKKTTSGRATPKNGEEQGFSITVEGKTYKILKSQLTGIEVREFREELGMGISAIFENPQSTLDLDTIAGLIWLVRRRSEPGLPYSVVAQSINYGSKLDFDAGSAVNDEGDDDPQL